MKQRVTATVILALIACLPVVAPRLTYAQNTVHVLGTFVKEGVAPPPEAVSEAKMFIDIAKAFPLKERTWRWIIIADDTMWYQMLIKMGIDHNQQVEYYGQTDIDRGITFIRGWTLLHPDRSGFEGCPEHVIAHEMAHVYLHSRDEKMVEETARQWVIKYRGNETADEARDCTL